MSIYVYYIFITIIPISSAFNCHFNSSSSIVRKTILLQLYDHEYLRIHNASMQVIVSENLSHPTDTLYGSRIHFINKIIFTGNIAEAIDDHYLENYELCSLTGYRFKDSYDNKCSVTFMENTAHSLDIDANHETALLRLAESCIQAALCNYQLDDIDKDADIYYQSIQSAINELVDFYIPRVIGKFLNDDGTIDIPPTELLKKFISVSQSDGKIKGLQTIQRTRDVAIQKVDSHFELIGMFRFEKLQLSILINIEIPLFNYSGKVKVTVNGLAFKVILGLDLTQDTCRASLVTLEVLANKDVKIDVPVLPFTLTYGLNDIRYYLKLGLDKYMHLLVLDCEEYINILPSMIKEWVGEY